MGHCARKPHSLAAARASHVLAVLTHSIIPRYTKAAVPVATELPRFGTVGRIWPISGKRVPIRASCLTLRCDGLLAAAILQFRSLSLREREIMIAVARGRLSSKQLAGDLGIAETTVKVHRSKAMRKMNVHSLPEFGRVADKLKLVPDDPQRP